MRRGSTIGEIGCPDISPLRSRGLEPIVLDHRSDRVSRAEWRCALQPLLPVRTSAADSRLYASKIRKFLKAIEALPLSGAFALDDPTGSESCDLVIVGSDEVWNLRHPWYGGCRLFYGDQLTARRLVSYAATFGNHPAATGLESFWAEGLRKFESISVRDGNSKTIVENSIPRGNYLARGNFARGTAASLRCNLWPLLPVLVQGSGSALGGITGDQACQRRLSQRLGR